MSFEAARSATPGPVQDCKGCGRQLAPGSLLCSACHALVHKDQLNQISEEARKLESAGQLSQARDKWLTAVPLLPGSSRQAQWIIDHTRAPDAQASLPPLAGVPAPKSENPWAKRLGPLGPVAILLAKGKALLAALFKLKFLFSFLAFFGVYWAAFGWKFGLGFATMILLHEMGHFVDIKRRGLPAEMPVFLPGLGAYVRWTALGVSLETRAAISLAGPLAGLLVSIACALVWRETGNQLCAVLARAGAVLNLLNLIPVWMLDGGQAVLALNKVERIALLTACLVLWLLLGENMLLLLALGAAYQVFFVRDLPATPSLRITAYFIAVVAALAVMIHLLPGQGIGLN